MTSTFREVLLFKNFPKLGIDFWRVFEPAVPKYLSMSFDLIHLSIRMSMLACIGLESFSTDGEFL
jgi:hypothetical protein